MKLLEDEAVYLDKKEPFASIGEKNIAKRGGGSLEKKIIFSFACLASYLSFPECYIIN